MKHIENISAAFFRKMPKMDNFASLRLCVCKSSPVLENVKLGKRNLNAEERSRLKGNDG